MMEKLKIGWYSNIDMKKNSSSSYSSAQPTISHLWLGLMVLLFISFFWARQSQSHQVVPESISEIQQNDRWNQMVLSLNEILDSYHGEVGFYIKDLKTGRSFERNADEPFVSASLIKFPILVATCQAISEGKISLDSKLKLRERDRRGGSGVLKWLHSGRTLRVSDVLYSMITRSDNTATAMIIDQLGFDDLNNRFSNLGLQVTRINPKGMSLASYINPNEDNYTTPREMGGLLERLYNHQLINDGLSDLMLEIMKGANHRGRLSKYLPGSWQFARKTGLLRKHCHDVGIVFTPHSDYVICVLTGKNSSYRTAKSFISNIGRKAYEYMGNT